MSTLASYIDHTILKPTTSHIEISKICKEAREYGFAAVCIPPPYVAQARGERVRVATVVGFPLGYSATQAKLAEVAQALTDGADELDVVINLSRLKEGDWATLETEMRAITEVIHKAGKLVKVIIESGLLSDEEIIRCCAIYGGLGVDFLKTSTGYADKGATVEAVKLMRQHLPANIRIKASGGIRTYAFAKELIAAGADRLGASAGVEILRGEASEAAANGY